MALKHLMWTICANCINVLILFGVLTESALKAVQLYDDCAGVYTVLPDDVYTLIVEGSKSDNDLGCLAEFHTSSSNRRIVHKFIESKIGSWDVSITVSTRASTQDNKRNVAFYTIGAAPPLNVQAEHDRYLGIYYGRLFSKDFSGKVEIWAADIDYQLQGWQISLIVTGCILFVLLIASIIAVVVFKKTKGRTGKVISSTGENTTVITGAYPVAQYPMTTAPPPTHQNLYPSTNQSSVPFSTSIDSKF